MSIGQVAGAGGEVLIAVQAEPRHFAIPPISQRKCFRIMLDREASGEINLVSWLWKFSLTTLYAKCCLSCTAQRSSVGASEIICCTDVKARNHLLDLSIPPSPPWVKGEPASIENSCSIFQSYYWFCKPG